MLAILDLLLLLPPNSLKLHTLGLLLSQLSFFLNSRLASYTPYSSIPIKSGGGLELFTTARALPFWLNVSTEARFSFPSSSASTRYCSHRSITGGGVGSEHRPVRELDTGAGDTEEVGEHAPSVGGTARGRFAIVVDFEQSSPAIGVLQWSLAEPTVGPVTHRAHKSEGITTSPMLLMHDKRASLQ